MQGDTVVYDTENKIEDKNTKRYVNTLFSNELNGNKKIHLNSGKLKNSKLFMNSKDNKLSKKENAHSTKHYPYLKKERELNEIISDEKNFIIKSGYKKEEKNESFIHESANTIYNNIFLKEKNLNDIYDFKNANKKNAYNSSNFIEDYIKKIKESNFNSVLNIIDSDIAKKKELYNKKVIEFNDFIYKVDCMYLQNWENEHEMANNEIESYIIQDKNMENEGKELLEVVENMISELRNLLQKIKKGIHINKDQMLNIQKEMNVLITRFQKIEEENYYSISQEGEYKYFLKKIGFQKKCRNMEFYQFYEKKLSEKKGKKYNTLSWNNLKNIANTKAKNVFKNFSNIFPKP
ncbi:hypothetical protein PGAL8A_00401600 [Plasmodium gallinaceum]|uniref:Uncharacterized protein n=1 Tax=Plasmodium gallinaceum TaxID=5849 RepID=A0A1J1GSM6_PLAGA|nr:hypothetical protein PGAL8A_00401600 [Plasmodium gallinaceum]CRG94312.1 hypothetical protein PGAL8A_00401600 [Plasmodium gallinaceum]